MSLESNWFRPQSCCVQSWNLNPSLRVSSWPVLPESSSWPLRGLPVLTCAQTQDTVDALGLWPCSWAPPGVQAMALSRQGTGFGHEVSASYSLLRKRVLSFLRLVTHSSGKEQGLALTSLGSNLSPAPVAWAVTGPL